MLRPAVITVTLALSLTGCSGALEESGQPASAAPAAAETFDAATAREEALKRAAERQRKAAQAAAKAAAERAAETAAKAPKQIGTAAQFSLDDQPAGEILVEDVRRITKPEGDLADYADPPANGEFVIVTMNARNIGSDMFPINPYDFYLRSANGTRYEYGDGNAMFATDTDRSINHTNLNPGEQVNGTIAFDAPPDVTELVYAPQSEALASWLLPSGNA